VSCHDPHRLPAAEERVAWYRGRCLTCHAEAACSLPAATRREQSPADSCIDCHMPRGGTADVAHAALTDHRLPRRPGQPPGQTPPASALEFPLVYFHRDLDPDRADVWRDLAVGMVEKARQIDAEEIRRAISTKALPYLETATAEDPDDVTAWEGIGYALRHQGRLQEAAAVQRAVLAKAPDRETALAEIAGVLENLGEPEAALGYWQRLVAVNPWPVAYHYQLAAAYGRQRDLPRALEELRRGLQRNPGDVPSRTLLVNLYLDQGDKARARAEFELLLAVDPSNKDELRRRFEGPSR
jgi:tetratricopeptide (TPR) repeat protein